MSEEKTLEALRSEHDLPALARLAVVNGQPQPVEAVGVRKRGEPTPVAPTDRFHIGSCTKAFTALLVGALVERGRLRWEATLAQSAPGRLLEGADPAWRSVTLEQLAGHRAGLGPPERSHPKGRSLLWLRQLSGPQEERRHVFLAACLADPPDFAPGSKYAYSNIGYALLGHLCEEREGMPYEALLAQRVLAPLGIESAGWGAPAKPGALEQPWGHAGAVPVPPGPFADNPDPLRPGGGLHLSLADWARFVGVFLDGATQPFRPETIARLSTPFAGGSYAGGWIVAERAWAKGAALVHAGSNTMNLALAWVAPRRRFAALATTNTGSDAASKACDAAIASLIRMHLP